MQESQIELEINNEFVDSPPMNPDIGGLEIFTIKHVKNPMYDGLQVDNELVRALFISMQKKISKLRIKNERKIIGAQTRPVQSAVVKLDQFGRVEMVAESQQRYELIEQISELMVGEMYESCNQNMTNVVEAFDLFWSYMSAIEYKADDLMSTLLICLQEFKMQKEPTIISNEPWASPLRSSIFEIELQKQKMTNENEGGLKQAETKIAIKIVSIREMLRIYFEKYPQKYKTAIEKVSGVENVDEKNMQKIIEEQVSRLGIWEFAVRIWTDVHGFEMNRALELGIIEPVFHTDKWILCPRWNRNNPTEGVKEISELIAKHYKTI